MNLQMLKRALISYVSSKENENLFDKYNINSRNAYINISTNVFVQIADSLSILVKCDPDSTYIVSHAFDGMDVFRACYIKSEPPSTGYFSLNAYSVTESPYGKILRVTTGQDCKFLVVQIKKSFFYEVIETLQINKI